MSSTATTFDSDCKLMLHLDGTNGQTTFIDSSSGAKSITRGGSAQISTAQFKFGSSSCLFASGTSDYLQIADSSDWDLGTGDFTIDFWIRPTTLDTSFGNGLFEQGSDLSNFISCGTNTSKQIIFTVKSGGSTIVSIAGTTVLAINNWYHVALINSGGTLKLYVNGTSEASSAIGTMPNISANFNIAFASFFTGTNIRFDGYFDEYRFVKGTAVWTSNFTPPTAAYISTQIGRFFLVF